MPEEEPTTNAAPQIYALLAKVSAEIPGIGKDGWNDHQKYPFRGIDDIMAGIHDALSKNGVAIMPEVQPDSIRHVDFETSKGIAMTLTEMLVKFTFSAPDGSETTCTVLGQGSDTGDKSANMAHTAAYKVMANEVFCIHMPGASEDSEASQDSKDQKRDNSRRPERNPGRTDPDGQAPRNGTTAVPAGSVPNATEDVIKVRTRIEEFVAERAKTNPDMTMEYVRATCQTKYKMAYDSMSKPALMNLRRHLGDDAPV